MPKAETCFDCHEDLAKEGERVRAYFDAARTAEGAYAFPKIAYSKDLKFDHAPHAKQSIECAACHGEPRETRFERKPLRALKASCMDCHREKQATLDCAACHEEIRRERKPESHDLEFRRLHGKEAPPDWRTGGGEALCSLCHEMPKSCDSCHMETKPATHATGGFRQFHGRGLSSARDSAFQESSCALCHKEQSCTICHQTQKPRTHTVAFERRLHGIRAETDRQNCRACHEQDFCQKCHDSQRPVSHTGNWGNGSQTHCLGCHEPLQSNGCYTCHKNTLSHAAATPLPADAAHAGPADCRSCHLVLPHFDNGESCRRCHR